MVRQLDMEQFAQLYRDRIVADFPRRERRPLRSIRKLYAGGRYVCLTLEEDGRTAAYASFVCDGTVGSVLLDYFAVDAARRGGGTGSRFLPELTAYWPEKDGILIECEAPAGAKSADAQTERERRIRFYERGGAEQTALLWRAFGVDYKLLWLPIRRGRREVDIAGEILALYSLAIPSGAVSRFVRVMPEEDAFG